MSEYSPLPNIQRRDPTPKIFLDAVLTLGPGRKAWKASASPSSAYRTADVTSPSNVAKWPIRQ